MFSFSLQEQKYIFKVQKPIFHQCLTYFFRPIR